MNIQRQRIVFIYVVLQHSTGILAQLNDGKNWNDVSIQMMDNVLPSDSNYYDASKRYPIHIRSVDYITIIQFKAINIHKENLFILRISACFDELPQDYGTVEGCEGEWTCLDWAGIGPKSSTNLCLENWSKYRYCVPNSNGKIQDYCKIACKTCGRSIQLPIGRHFSNSIEKMLY